MKRQPVTSSKILSIGHNPITKEMDIEFRSYPRKGETEAPPPTVYRYQNVEVADHAALVEAESIGRHFGAFFQKNAARFPYRKLTQEEAAQ